VSYSPTTVLKALKTTLIILAVSFVFLLFIVWMLPYLRLLRPLPGEVNVAGMDAMVRKQCMTSGNEAFCEEFQRQMDETDPQTRRIITRLKDLGIRARIADAVVERGIARWRQERMFDVVVSDRQLVDVIQSLLGQDLGDDTFRGEIAQMSMRFKGMLYDVLVNGTKSEKSEEEQHIRFYLASKAGNYRKPFILDVDDIRGLIQKGGNVTLCGQMEYYVC